MAITTAPSPASAPAPSTAKPNRASSSSVSKFLSRWRSKRSKGEVNPGTQDKRPPLIPSPLPLILPHHQAVLDDLGWSVITFPNASESHAPPPAPGAHPLQTAAQDLFAASQIFFSLPESEKQKWVNKQLGSEEGWSCIPGEKEFITLRTLAGTPDVLKEAAQRYWNLMGDYLDGCLGRLGTRIGVRDEGADHGLRRYIGRCKQMGIEEQDRSATMLRLFRYEGATTDFKIVAEPHADLGLLSCVVGDVPGLEVWDGFSFYPVEREEFGNQRRHDGKVEVRNAALLVGRQLEALSNKRFRGGGHRVVSYPPASGPDAPPQYRFSIVSVLRACEDVVVDTDVLTTDITGAFEKPIRGVTAGEWYEGIRKKHFNINVGYEEREKQRRSVMEKRTGDGVDARAKEMGTG
ncbi:uncharacterized protein EI97DRAFT_414600 [Westerdykella ornata]|uniref:Clavaminate synthase-like protein n=1 Tax=Westerdykella ornata TaxID=318751 RepID=A0A6A6JQS0_WESOR|nr:uncharacterized protein EI97DRAFT_414600 [Westerdykella ornata]KAF2278248.1 hypothetical protein EI97DRAFT_414600 [Westerdykella ornata]